MYKTEFCDRNRWRDVVSWIHHDTANESSRTQNALDTLQNDSAKGVVGVVRESFSGHMVAGSYTAAMAGGVVSIGAVRIDRNDVLDQTVALLRGTLSQYVKNQVELIQAIATEFTVLERQVLEGIGLRYLAHLDHLVLFLENEKRAAGKAVDALSSSAKGLRLREFRAGDEATLERVVTDSYIDTLDCPLLGDLRTGKAAVEGYLANRDQKHSWWFAEVAGEAIGCLLLWERAPAIWELTYMGIIPSARGRKFGAVLLEAAIAVANQMGAGQLVLSVDRENQPATRLYHQRGFYCYNSTEVWFGGGSILSAS
ncbi:MAG: GNAT family N-acetyltransferase [Planctomycetaceae bacterium]|nr:GNAT family N-acetyltransferase [Planctomycetaceae bacterium]